MATATRTVAALLKSLGNIPSDRVRLEPHPGTATVKDALRILAHEGRICELIDGVLVEKPMSGYESVLGGVFVQLFRNYLDQNPLGVVLGADGLLRILPGQLRAPDAAFIRFERIPDPEPKFGRAPRWIPNLAVEVLSPGNTAREMRRKLKQYFEAGVELVWMIDPPTRTAKSYRSTTEFDELAPDGVLTAPAILPGFELPLSDLFRRAQLSRGQ
jgi:Uma2 family endonuclease